MTYDLMISNPYKVAMSTIFNTAVNWIFAMDELKDYHITKDNEDGVDRGVNSFALLCIIAVSDVRTVLKQAVLFS